jgi:hypothetical protein
MKKHKHHIIPKHMGGTDDPSNLVELSIEEHAEAHKKLWEQHGCIEDKIAYECLSGRRITEEDRILLAISGFRRFLNNPIAKEEWINNIKHTRKNQVITDSHRKSLSISLKKAHDEGRFVAFYSEETRNAMRKRYNENNMKEKLSLARKQSEKWKNSVSSPECREKKRLSSPKSKKVSVNGVVYDSIRHAVKETSYNYNRLRTILMSNVDDNIFFC